jgi:hypothetical protein
MVPVPGKFVLFSKILHAVIKKFMFIDKKYMLSTINSI